ncbi:MAG: prolipoprotein diacylglyceryl transferase [Myxococcota bacterium]|nr:prolipoprotein diacylglyceryl transferase [Myxococcota bacterium]
MFRLPFDIPGVGGSYFTCLAVGFILATILLRRWAKHHGIDPRLMVDFIIWMLIWGVVGSRILHVIADGKFWDYINLCRDPSLVDWKIDVRECRALRGVWDAARNVCHPAQKNCWAWADITAGGLAFYGGFVAAALFSIYYIRRYNMPAGKMIDMAGWSLMLGLAWGRMGCFLSGCCFGVRAEPPLGVIFPDKSAASRFHWDQGWLHTYRIESLPVIPTQIYSAFAGIAIAAIAYFWLRPRKRFDGEVFCIAAFLYAAFRFFIEFFRSDERGGLGGLSTSQIVAIGFALCCAYLWIYFKKRARKTIAQTPTD